jgi:hypothetical protein
MKAIENNGRPAIVINEHDEFGEPKKVMHCMDIDSARKLRDELTETIKRCVVLEAVELNKHGQAVENYMLERHGNVI